MVSSRQHVGRRGSAGFTLLELLVSVALLVILLGKVSATMDNASQFLSQSTAEVILESQAHRTLDRVALAVMGSDRSTLFPVIQSPQSSTSLDFRVSLGVEEGEVVWNDPERIGVGAQTNQLVWLENPGTTAARQVVWTNLVRPYLEGEVQNGIDDNGNGIVDERGLSFVIEGNSVTIYLTLGRELPGGGFSEETVQTTVTVRNLFVGGG